MTATTDCQAREAPAPTSRRALLHVGKFIANYDTVVAENLRTENTKEWLTFGAL